MEKKAADLRRLTAVLLGGAAVLLGIYDIVVAYNDVKGDTISELVRDISHSWYILPYAFGVITGHFFWNKAADEMLPKKQHLLVFFGVVCGSCALVLVRDLVNVFWTMRAFEYANLTLVVVGFFVGAKFWPQHMPKKEEQPDV
jgi:uncharacterized membrane protein